MPAKPYQKEPATSHVRASYELGIGLAEIQKDFELEKRNNVQTVAFREYREAIEQVKNTQSAHAQITNALADSNARCAGLSNQNLELSERLDASHKSLASVTEYSSHMKGQLEAAIAVKEKAEAMLQSYGEQVDEHRKTLFDQAKEHCNTIVAQCELRLREAQAEHDRHDRAVAAAVELQAQNEARAREAALQERAHANAEMQAREQAARHAEALAAEAERVANIERHKQRVEEAKLVDARAEHAGRERESQNYILNLQAQLRVREEEDCLTTDCS